MDFNGVRFAPFPDYNCVSMSEKQQWKLAVSRFAGFASNLPMWVDEEHVAQYHSIIVDVEKASGEDLSHFKIPDKKLRPKVAQAQLGVGGHPGHVRYTDKKFCDTGYFRSQVEGLAHYLNSMRGDVSGHEVPTNEDTYRSLTDHQLEEIMLNRRIAPKKVVDQTGERYVYDREYVIAALLRDDRPKPGPTPTQSTVFNVYGSNVIHSSPGSSITQTQDFKGEEFKNLINQIKQVMLSEKLPEADRVQIKVDIGTVELQINSPKPNSSIIQSCMHSVRSILENAAGTLIASGIISGINRFFP